MSNEMYETTRETLTKYPDSQLAETVNSNMNSLRTSAATKAEKALLNLTTQIDNLRFNPGEMLNTPVKIRSGGRNLGSVCPCCPVVRWVYIYWSG